MNPAMLTESVQAIVGPLVDDFPDVITTKYGESIELIDPSGRWVRVLTFEDIGCGTERLRWGEQKHAHPILEWAYRWWAIERLELLSDHTPTREIGNLLRTAKFDDSTIERTSFLNWAVDHAISASVKQRFDIISGLRSFYRWCLEEELDFTSERGLIALQEVRLSRRDKGNAVTLLDPVAGPYTQRELRLIEKELNNLDGLLEEKCIFLLCRDWGLRPVQIALLRAEDVGRDELGAYIDVPSVKGGRSRLRRSSGNYKRRYIADDTEEACLELVAANHQKANQLLDWYYSNGVVDKRTAAQTPIPLIVSPKALTRAKRQASDNGVKEYLLHTDATKISRKIRNLTTQLGIPVVRATGDAQANAQLEIGCYRLRRTVGTTLVLNGASPDEVAEALDHADTSSIQHYFRFSPEIIDYVNGSQNHSPEIRQAVDAWAGRLISRASASLGAMATVGGLGRCASTKPCPYQPTITCYSCHKFRPYREADHRAARDEILKFRDTFSQNATGAGTLQIEDAIAGVDSLLASLADSDAQV